MSAKTKKADSESNETAVAVSEKAESVFSKQQLIKSERFKDRKDIVNAILSDDKKYTISAVYQAVEKYMKGKVK